MQAELEQTYPRLGTIYSLCSVYYPNIRQRSDVLNRWNFLKTGFYEGINLARIMSLFWIGSAYPQYLNVAHLLVWQTAIILLAIVLWLFWIERVAGARDR